MNTLETLIIEAKHCQECSKHLPNEPRPIFQIGKNAKILIIGQAPGRKVQDSGIPFQDASGDRLRDWMGISSEQFYDPDFLAIMPMGFCYPGKGSSGDLPPRSECAPLWHAAFLSKLPNIQLTLLIGQYAQAYYLKESLKESLTKTVEAWETYLPEYLPLPHPSPRNNIWLKKNPWFERDVVTELQRRIRAI
ncbi:MAG: uracil-DNA glycosylase family protein [Cyanobacteria bacterium]|nr:uracil-DNA glycosylase family protein [Cyanobacteriota bacterium]